MGTLLQPGLEMDLVVDPMVALLHWGLELAHGAVHGFGWCYHWDHLGEHS